MGELPELAPEAAPIIRGLFIGFGLLCGSIVAWGLIELVDAFVRALFGTVTGPLGWIPYGNKIVGTPIHKIEQKVTNFLGRAEAGFSARIGQYFRDMAGVIVRVGDTFVSQAKLGFLTNLTISNLLVGGASTKTSVAKVQKAQKLTTAQVKAADARGRVQVKTQAATTAHVINRTTVIVKDDANWRGYTKRQLRYLRASIAAIAAVVGVGALEGAGEKVGGLVGGLAGVRHRVGRLEKTLAGLGAVALIGTALRRMGLGFLQCRNVKRAGRAVCGMPLHLLEDALALFTDFLVLANICQVIPWLEAAFSEVAAPLIGTLAGAGAGLCSPASKRPARLKPPALYLPAEADSTLYLA